MPRFTLPSGLQLDYFDLGPRDGTPVVFLHGYLDSWRIWEAVLQDLDPGYRVVAPTLRGFGDSDKPEEGYDMSSFVDDIDLFLTGMKLGPSIVVGHSMGGLIAHHLAIAHPQHLRKLVLVGTAATGAGNQNLAGSALDAVLNLTDPVPAGFAREAQCEQIVTPVPDARLDCIVHESEKVPARVWKGAMLGMMHEDHRALLHRIEAPTLVCYGDGDIFFTPQDQEELTRLIPDAYFRLYPAVGHGIQWEVPSDLARDLNAFFRAT